MRPFGLAPIAVAVAAAFFANESFALPTGAQVRAGQGTVSSPSAGSVVVRQASARLAIDWQSFGIAAGESVRFVQPSYPGETIRVELAEVPDGTVQFRAWALERQVLVLDRGLCRLAPP